MRSTLVLSWRTLLALCGLLMSLLMALPAAQAAPEADGSRWQRRYNTTMTYTLPPSEQVSGYVVVDLQMVARLWTLMGEPVVYCSASWKMRNANVKVKRRGEWHILLTQGMPESTYNAVSLVQATIGFPVARKNISETQVSEAWLPCDIGAANDSGDARGSFNVPGSPDWNRLFISRARYDGRRDWDHASNYLSPAEAKALMKSADHELRRPNGGDHSDMALLMEFNFWPWIGWFDEQQAQKETQRVAERNKTRQRIGNTLDPFDQMVQEVETTLVERSTASDLSRTRTARDGNAEQLARKRDKLAQQGCLPSASAAGLTADIEAAAERAEASHARCGSGLGVVAYRDDKSRKWGFKRPDGSVLIEPRFERADNFSEGLGMVHAPECGENACYVNAGGAVVLKTDAVRAGSFSEGLAWARERGSYKVGYIDREGRFVIAPRYRSGEAFKEGRAKVELFVRSVAPANPCSSGRAYYSVGPIGRDGQWAAAPTEQSENTVGQICLTRN